MGFAPVVEDQEWRKEQQTKRQTLEAHGLVGTPSVSPIAAELTRVSDAPTNDTHPASLLDPVRRYSRTHPHLREFLCGGTAAAINIVVTFPLNKVMFRQQLLGLNTWSAYLNVKSEGIRMLYRGVKPPLLQAAVSKSLMFGLYNWYDELLVEQLGNQTGIHLLAAFLSGTTEAVLAPFERAQTLLQTPKFNGHISGAYDAILHLNNKRLVLRTARPIARVFPFQRLPKCSRAERFRLWCHVGAVISTVCFPINVARTRMQSIYGEPFIGAAEAIRLTYEERGRNFRRVYRGVHMNFFRSLLSWGIINSAYERLKTLT
ncbi:hypothetical protein Poli38472_007672 [Pythium oligandrum]|uniref:Mitochondrial carrier protein n=1 Tax=Pythium oligandrum TaxID=41045 RepID=A0A8K1CSN4_PYTOL|nr:hypothetical protein Poli38472_007672 [Pythium oligandrum]|eukprot:TMW68000.1 hypothetical protein Poli38472_007672 [Pythium oligandrum]